MGTRKAVIHHEPHMPLYTSTIFFASILYFKSDELLNNPSIVKLRSFAIFEPAKSMVLNPNKEKWGNLLLKR